MTIYPGTTEGLVKLENGSMVRYLDSGDSPTLGSSVDGRTVVLLHGTGGTAEQSFWALFPMLATKYRTIALTYDMEAESVTLTDLVDQTSAVIEDRSPGSPVVLVGHSLGAVVATTVAAVRRELVETLVSVAGWVRTDRQQLLRNDVWQELNNSNSAALAHFMTYCSYSRKYLEALTPDELAALVGKVADGPDRSKAMKLNRSIDISSTIADIVCPTLVIGCTYDQVASPAQSQLMFGGIATACYFEMPTGHAAMHERPSELFTTIRGFLRSPLKYPAGSVVSPAHA